MSDEIKKMEDEAPKTETSELSEPALDEVVGGTAVSRLPTLQKTTDITLKRGVTSS